MYVSCISSYMYPPDHIDVISHNSIHCIILGSQSTPDGQNKNKNLHEYNLKKC